jgi:uncharacterized protein YcaQ
MVLELSREQARRVAVRAQLLDAARPTDLVDVVRQLTFVQLEPTAAVAPTADLVLWSRLGREYSPGDLEAAVTQNVLFELDLMVRPMEDLALFRAQMAEPPRYDRAERWLDDNDSFREDILELLETDGPLTAREIPDSSIVSWPSSGWNSNRNVVMMLDILVGTGEVAVAGRRGRDRLWDLAERVYHSDIPAVPLEEAVRIRNERRLRSQGVVPLNTPDLPAETTRVGDAGEPATIEGVRGQWRVDPAALEQPFSGRTALLSPFDGLVRDRRRMADLFEFEYALEMYKPAAKRRWGYYALPILHGDRLVGKVDATADRERGELVVHAVHEDVEFTPEILDAVETELDSLALWLGLARSR